jgi:hypothetical protein
MMAQFFHPGVIIIACILLDRRSGTWNGNQSNSNMDWMVITRWETTEMNSGVWTVNPPTTLKRKFKK